jgi:hypothetical protein
MHMTACAHYSNEIGLQALRLENFPDFRGKQRLIVFTPKHVITGGRASDGAMRSLVISYKLLGTREWFVIHHTHCGMETFTDDIMRGLLKQSLKTASVDASGWHDSAAGGGSKEGAYIDWLTIAEQAESVSAATHWCRATSRSTAISTMLQTGVWWKCRKPRRSAKPLELISLRCAHAGADSNRQRGQDEARWRMYANVQSAFHANAIMAAYEI